MSTTTPKEPTMKNLLAHLAGIADPAERRSAFYKETWERHIPTRQAQDLALAAGIIDQQQYDDLLEDARCCQAERR